jgi:hypothetical protein
LPAAVKILRRSLVAATTNLLSGDHDSDSLTSVSLAIPTTSDPSSLHE